MTSATNSLKTIVLVVAIATGWVVQAKTAHADCELAKANVEQTVG